MLAVATVTARSAAAVSLDGAVRLGWSSTEFDSTEVAGTDRSANLSLAQEITPYLSLRLYGNYGEQTTGLDGDEVFSRRSVQPIAELRYAAPTLAWRLGWETSRIDSSSVTQEFETTALNSSLSWRPRGGFRLGLGYRESSNESDEVAALGRGLDQRHARLDLGYDRQSWSLGYGASYNELEGGAGSLAIEQIRHDLRLSASRDFAGDRLRLSFAGTAGRLEAEEARAAGDIGELVTAVQGLYGIDASPALGTLAAAPGLVDGETAVATAPPIEIGGASAFRNVGLDFGLPLPATRLDVVVDRASGEQVVWDVYQSADGLIWEPVAVAARSWDPDLLRYRLRFPETSERYLKAVNVSSNPVTDVRVTELVALRDLSTAEGARPERSSELYRAAAGITWRIGSRMRFAAGAETSNDATTVGGVVRRDTTGSGLRAGIDLDAARHLVLGVNYRQSRWEDRRADGLTRISDDLGATLRWTPLDTVDALLAAGVHSDSDDRQELSSLEFARLMVSLDLLEELRLVTDVGSSRIETLGTGSRRETLSWTQRLEMRPRRHWRVNGGYTWSRVESAVAADPLFESSSVFVDFGWTPGSALSLVGTVSYFDESSGSTVRQSFNLSWNPGPKLGVSLGWDQYEQRDGLFTANDSLAVNYQVATRLVLFAAVTRSRNQLSAGAENEVTSFNAGTTLSF